MGHVGVGLGKANEVISSISKAKDKAKRNIFKATIINGTIPHKIVGKYGASRVLLKPAAPGTGIIAGAPVRAVMEQVGVNNILTKRYGSSNQMNIVRATINALENLQDAVQIANKRGIKIKDVFT
jgi:small subunit ribosomal protein S5